MTVQDIIEDLLYKVSKDEDISIDDIRKIIEGLSVEDPVANKDALTIFYSGEEEALVNELVAKVGEDVRILRRQNLKFGDISEDAITDF